VEIKAEKAISSVRPQVRAAASSASTTRLGNEAVKEGRGRFDRGVGTTDSVMVSNSVR
jgi:hypothetical protein